MHADVILQISDFCWILNDVADIFYLSVRDMCPDSITFIFISIATVSNLKNAYISDLQYAKVGDPFFRTTSTSVQR